MADRLTACDLVARLRNKFPPDAGYILLEQVRNATGFVRGASYIDAAVFSTWPSTGLIRSAFEVKVDRSDFLSELQKPKKNQWARDCFHEFWYVSPPDVIKEAELPEGCGWMKTHGKGLSIVRHAPKKVAPIMDDSLLASFMRSAVKGADASDSRLKKQVLEDSHDYKQAKLWKSAAEKYLKTRSGASLYSVQNVDTVYQALLEASPDAQAKKDRDQIVGVLNQFRIKMGDLFELFAMMSHHTLLETDEAGDYVVRTWGGRNEFSLEGLKKLRKSTKANDSFSKRRYDKMTGLLECLNFLSDEFLKEKN